MTDAGRYMKRLLQINPVLRMSTSTGRIMQEIGDLAMRHGWESYVAYSRGRDGVPTCTSRLLPVGGWGSVAWHGLMTRLLDRHGLASAGATRQLLKRVDSLQPDVVHLHNLHGYFLHYPLLFRYLATHRMPVVWTVHDCWLYTGHCYHYSSAECMGWQTGCGHCPQRELFPASWLVDRSHRNYIDKERAFTSIPRERMVLVTPSAWMAREVRRSFLGAYDTRVIPNGIDTDAFRPCRDDEWLASHGLTGKHILLGVASVWSRAKGLDDFMRLATLLRPDERIVLVGLDGHAARHLPAGVVPLARTANVQQLAALYSMATALVNPTWQDNYPTVNLEAMACGTPVVTYRTGGSPEAVTPRTGMVVAQGDVEGLMRSVRLVERRGKEAYAAPCRQHALAHFRKEDRYMDYLRLYDEMACRIRH